MKRNIALMGKAKSGKGVIAEYLRDTHGYRVVSFARPVKVACGRMVLGNGVYEHEALDYVNEHKDAFRPMLQAYGMAMRTLVAEDYWVRYALASIEGYNDFGCPVVVDDCRFPNEADALREAGFLIVEVFRPEWHRWSVGGLAHSLDSATAAHTSETELERIAADVRLVNNRSPAALVEQLEGLL